MTRSLSIFILLLAAPAWAQLQPKFDVTRATYGAGATKADVTERVRSQIVNGGLSILVNAETLGIDPVPNTRKTLTVEYRQGIFRRTARANDFETLRLGNASAAPVESLRITKAQYGDGRRMRDVTDLLNGKVASGRLELLINNANLGGDPAPAVKKVIVVEYDYNGRAATARLAEGETLRLPDSAVASSAPAALSIVKATYAAGRAGSADVTSAVSALIVGNTLELTVNGAALRSDPAPGVAKILSVEYDLDGQRHTVSARDGEVLRINKTGPFNGLRIVRALYTAGRAGTADVTSVVSGLISADTLELAVNGATLRTDPAPGAAKTLSVEYDLNGQRHTVTARDGETLRINKAAPVSTFRVIRATYAGGRRNSADVTRAVTARVSGDSLELTVNGDTLGVDPAPGTVKTLTVEYELDGRRQTATAKDAEILVLPPVTSFHVISANYGVRGRTIDVTNNVSARRSGLRVNVPVTSETMGGDPAPGVVKTLTVEYEINGRRRVATAMDGETLRAPGAGAPPVSAAIDAVGATMTGITAKGPVTMTADSSNVRTACLYRQPDFTGEAVCFSSVQAQSAIGNPQLGFRSLRLNGVTAVDVFEQQNFNGRSHAITADVPDLLVLRRTFWRYESAAPIQSARVR